MRHEAEATCNLPCHRSIPVSSVPNLHKIIMRRFSIILLLILYSSLSALAQQTYFYRLNGVVTNGIKKAPGFSSGIFVTFSKDICYDSDRDGFYANNGKLTKIVEGTDADQYRGNCYFGNAEYIVSKSRDLINVRCADGIIYVYYRESPLASDTRSTYGNIPRKLSDSAPAVPIQQPSDNSFNTPRSSSSRSLLRTSPPGLHMISPAPSATAPASAPPVQAAVGRSTTATGVVSMTASYAMGQEGAPPVTEEEQFATKKTIQWKKRNS